MKYETFILTFAIVFLTTNVMGKSQFSYFFYCFYDFSIQASVILTFNIMSYELFNYDLTMSLKTF